MNKKGFTLVELLAILTVLGIIILVAMPALVESNRVAKENEKKDFEEMVITACETYVAVVPSPPETITIEALVAGGYLKKGTKSPDGTEAKDMDEAVTISNGTCQYTYNS